MILIDKNHFLSIVDKMNLIDKKSLINFFSQSYKVHWNNYDNNNVIMGYSECFPLFFLCHEFLKFTKYYCSFKIFNLYIMGKNDFEEKLLHLQIS